MTQSRILIVTNPASGKGRVSNLFDDVLEELRRGGATIEICETRQKGCAEAAIREACRAVNPPDCVAVSGGDGTVQEVAASLAVIRNEMGDSCPAMGLIPTGRCNDFARAVGIRRDVPLIVDALLRGTPGPFDLGRANGRYFCTVAALGVDAEVSSYVDTKKLPVRGTAAYLIGALAVLSHYQPHHMRIEGDFGLIERDLFMVSSANTPIYGGNMRIVPHADPADGVLDICLIDPVSRLKAFSLLPKVMAGRHVNLPNVQFLRSKRFTIAADPSLTMWADGERIAQTTVTIEVAPRAIRVLQPSVVC